MKRCPNKTRRNKKTKRCVSQRKRCSKGLRRNKKTKTCKRKTRK